MRQFFGMGRDLGKPMEALVEGVHEGLRLGHQRVLWLLWAARRGRAWAASRQVRGWACRVPGHRCCRRGGGGGSDARGSWTTVATWSSCPSSPGDTCGAARQRQTAA